MPGEDRYTEIPMIYEVDEAYEVIKRSMEDYNIKFDNLGKLLS
jgi:inorganic pyrophosphatase